MAPWKRLFTLKEGHHAVKPAWHDRIEAGRRSVKISRREFDELVKEALDGLPDRFAEAIENVSVVVEDEPTVEDLESVGLDPERDTLLGLYQGIALPDRGLDYSALPDRIVVYRLPTIEVCEERRQVVREVRQTVLHELGHYFGLEEDEIPE